MTTPALVKYRPLLAGALGLLLLPFIMPLLGLTVNTASVIVILAIAALGHNLDLVLALADRVFALERGAVFHDGPAEKLFEDLEYRKEILWL